MLEEPLSLKVAAACDASVDEDFFELKLIAIPIPNKVVR